MITELQLREIRLLEALDGVELAELAPLLIERRFDKNSYIIQEDDVGPSIMFIADGEVKVTVVGEEGKELVLALLKKGDFFGEMSLLTGEDRSANVVAMSDCRLYVLLKEDFERHLANNSGMALSLLRELALRLRIASEKISDLVLLDVYNRVARTLTSLGDPTELNGERVIVIESRPTHQDLANMVGTSREMVSRAFKALEEDGCIEVEGKRVLLRSQPI